LCERRVARPRRGAREGAFEEKCEPNFKPEPKPEPASQMSTPSVEIFVSGWRM